MSQKILFFGVFPVYHQQVMLTLLVICLVIPDQNIISRALCKAVRQTGSRVYLSSYWRCVVNFSGPKGFLIVYCLHLHIEFRACA